MDLILDGSHLPEFDDLTKYIKGSARELWIDFTNYIHSEYQSSPKITFSKCSGKPGWNVKYQKAGKAICTLYPEKERFVALVIVTLDLLPLIEGASDGFEPEVWQVIKNAKPFNNTLWLMIGVESEAVLEDVKRLLILKRGG